VGPTTGISVRFAKLPLPAGVVLTGRGDRGGRDGGRKIPAFAGKRDDGSGVGLDLDLIEPRKETRKHLASWSALQFNCLHPTDSLNADHGAV